MLSSDPKLMHIFGTDQWSYKEIPGLDTKVVVHQLSIGKGVSPKKQPQQHFRPELITEIERR